MADTDTTKPGDVQPGDPAATPVVEVVAAPAKDAKTVKVTIPATLVVNHKTYFAGEVEVPKAEAEAIAQFLKGAVLHPLDQEEAPVSDLKVTKTAKK